MLANSSTLSPLNFDAAIVDLDGTMIDTMGDFVVALNLMLEDLQVGGGEGTAAVLDPDTVERMVGKGSEHLIRSVLAHVLGAERGDAALALQVEALYPAAWKAYQQHYLAVNGQHANVYPGVLEGLEQLRAAGLTLACLTNKPLSFAQPLLASKGLDGFFSRVFGGDSFERKKPDPLPLLKTCEALGTRPQRTLMIGDSSNDAKAARAAGCTVVLVTYGYNHGQPVREVDADGFVSTLGELGPFLTVR